MNSETRTALIELWREVPECRPSIEGDELQWIDTPHGGYWYIHDGMDSFGEQMAAMMARDAIVEWLEAQGWTVQTRKQDIDHAPSCRHVSECRKYISYEDGIIHLCEFGPTRLSALIAAARAVPKGAERGE